MKKRVLFIICLFILSINSLFVDSIDLPEGYGYCCGEVDEVQSVVCGFLGPATIGNSCGIPAIVPVSQLYSYGFFDYPYGTPSFNDLIQYHYDQGYSDYPSDDYDGVILWNDLNGDGYGTNQDGSNQWGEFIILEANTEFIEVWGGSAFGGDFPPDIGSGSGCVGVEDEGIPIVSGCDSSAGYAPICTTPYSGICSCVRPCPRWPQPCFWQEDEPHEDAYGQCANGFVCANGKCVEDIGCYCRSYGYGACAPWPDNGFFCDGCEWKSTLIPELCGDGKDNNCDGEIDEDGSCEEFCKYYLPTTPDTNPPPLLEGAWLSDSIAEEHLYDGTCGVRVFNRDEDGIPTFTIDNSYYLASPAISKLQSGEITETRGVADLNCIGHDYGCDFYEEVWGVGDDFDFEVGAVFTDKYRRFSICWDKEDFTPGAPCDVDYWYPGYQGGDASGITLSNGVCTSYIPSSSNLCIDDDEDGFCSLDSEYDAEYITTYPDCDDGNFDVNPNFAEVCNDGIDNDCDGYVDDMDCSDCYDPPPTFCYGEINCGNYDESNCPNICILESQSSPGKEVFWNKFVNFLKNLFKDEEVSLSQSHKNNILRGKNYGKLGCTDSDAINYDIMAKVDDRGCEYTKISSNYLDCYIQAESCNLGDLSILSVSGENNVHAGLVSSRSGSSEYQICCQLEGISLTEDNPFILLSSFENAHVQNPSYGEYLLGVGFSDQISCVTRSTSCVNGEFCLFEYEGDSSAPTNAHITQCGEGYNWTVCCGGDVGSGEDILGCTNEIACNYNEYANLYDGSCYFCYNDDCEDYPSNEYDCDGNFIGLETSCSSEIISCSGFSQNECNSNFDYGCYFG
tara:strand:- start:588 stop:3125 length:2538 start_codon:yes stop_codon:yes gene_type:complete